MAAKLPVITSRGTPWQEIEEYDAGWWVDLDWENIDKALAEALFCDGNILKKKGLNGFNLIQKYDWKFQAQKMKKVYEWLLGNEEKPEFVFDARDKLK
jgi:glycosyltransferase involved in cell wall biosynthesis